APRGRCHRGTAQTGTPIQPLRHALAAAAGRLLALSFPKFGHPGLGWIALAPLLVALAAHGPDPAPPRNPFRLGLLTGVVYFAGTLYWVVGTMHTYGGLAIPIAVIACVLLVVFLALYVGLFAWSVG